MSAGRFCPFGPFGMLLIWHAARRDATPGPDRTMFKLTHYPEQQMIECVLDIWETPGGSGAREILPSLPVAVAGMRPAKDAA
jgi:hypothetical protein